MIDFLLKVENFDLLFIFSKKIQSGASLYTTPLGFILWFNILILKILQCSDTFPIAGWSELVYFNSNKQNLVQEPSLFFKKRVQKGSYDTSSHLQVFETKVVWRILENSQLIFMVKFYLSKVTGQLEQLFLIRPFYVKRKKEFSFYLAFYS